MRVLILGVVISFNTWGGRVERFNHSLKSYQPTKVSNLKSFKIQSYDYKVTLNSGESFGSAMYASFKTKKVAGLNQYGVLQLIKGCHFESSIVNGKKRKYLSRSRHLFGELVKYKHKDWTIDSIDSDPMYGSYDGDRYWSYKWNTSTGSISEKTEKLYRLERPTNPELYVSDYPGTAFLFYKQEAMNISLKFKTCIYLRDDIPRKSTPSEVDLSKAIACHDWSSSFIYNHDKRVYESPKELDPFCVE